MLVCLKSTMRARNRNPTGAVTIPNPLFHQAHDVLDANNVNRRSQNVNAGWQIHSMGQGFNIHIETASLRFIG
jgi:hypothetical protein